MEDLYQFFKKYLANDAVFYSALLILISVSSFGLGRWSMVGVVPTNQPAAIVMTESVPIERTAAGEEAAASSPAATTGTYVASKNGSKYHLPYCPSAQQMKEENKIWFSSKEEAQAQGYTPAANCPDI